MEYTGDDVPLLGICKGDQLSAFEDAIITKLLSALDGTGVTFADLTIDCDFINDIIDGEDETLATIIQALVTANCTLKTLVDGLSATVNAPFTADTSCLTLPTTPTRDDILAALIVKVCTNSTTVDTIASDYIKASELCAAVNVCLAAINDGNSDTVVQEYTKMAKYSPQAYIGPLSVFDSSGKGILASGYDKVYLCNGNNGTPDLRGATLLGANTNIVGPALNAAVDPSLAANAGYSIVIGTRVGAYTHTLTTIQFPAHTHPVTDPGHTHTLSIINGRRLSGSTTNTPSYGIDPVPRTTIPGALADNSKTNITIGTTGGDQPHNNTQPSYGVAFIIYLP